MSPDDHARLMVMFDDLCDAPVDEQRQAILDLRREDLALANELAALLDADAIEDDAVDRAADAGLDGLLASTGVGVPTPGPNEANDGFLPGTRIDDRYVLERRLGSGGAGIVYQGHDTETDRRVALKFLRGGLNEHVGQRRRFEREFRAVARLDHPGCVRVFALGEHEERPYLVMEYVDGGDLTRLSRAPAPVLLPVLIQLTSALDHIHSHQIVHRDLKPANVLLTRDAHEALVPKLADFGIVKVADDSMSLTDAGVVIGTIDFLSPEQMTQDEVDPRSDLYSLGCMIFMLWTGEPAFPGSLIERLNLRVRQSPRRMSSVLPDTPAGLDDLVLRLIAADPADRPSSALAVGAELMQVLRQVTVDGARRFASAFAQPQTGGFLYPPGLIGRDAERARVLAAVEGETPVVAVVGSAGSGKTALTQAAVQSLTKQGWRLLVARVIASDAAPFAPFPALRAQLQTHVTEPSADASPMRRRMSIRRAEAGAQVRRVMAENLFRQLSEQARSRPLLVLLEDMHEAGVGAVQLLSELVDLARDGGADQLRWIVTARPRGQALLEQKIAADGLEVVELAPLLAADVEAIACRVLGAQPADVPSDLLARLRDGANGNPLLVTATVRAMVDQGVLRRDASRWVIEAGADLLTVESAIEAVLQQRLAGLAAKTREALQVAALIGVSFAPRWVAEALQMSPEALVDAWDEAVAASVIHADEDTESYRFDHARLADVLCADLSPARAASHHDRLAALMVSENESVARIAFHFGHGSDDSKARRWLRQAAEEALVAYDFGAAAKHFAQLVPRLPADDPDRRWAEEAWADAWARGDKAPAAADAFERLAQGAGSALERARLIRKRALALLRTDGAARAADVLREALATLGEVTPRSLRGMRWQIGRDVLGGAWRAAFPQSKDDARLNELVLIHRELGMLARWSGATAAAMHLTRLFRLAHKLRHSDLRIDACNSMAMFFAFAGMPRLSTYFAKRARVEARSSEDIVGLAWAELMRGGTELILRNDQAAAVKHLDRANVLGETISDPQLNSQLRSYRGWARLFMSMSAGAAEDFHEAERRARAVASDWLVLDARCGGMVQSIVAGRFAEARAVANEVLVHPIILNFPALECLATEGLGAIAFLEGRNREAVQLLDRASEAYARADLDRIWGFLVQLERAEALLTWADEEGADAIDDFHGRLARCAKASRRHMGRLPLYAGCDAMMRGICAARKGRRTAALKLFDKARSARDGGDYMRAWVRMRSAFERLHLGAAKEAIRPELDAVDLLYEGLGQVGLRNWLVRQRARHQV